jgi:hypothetical protein
MEWGDEETRKESSRGGAWPFEGLGAERGQEARQPRKWPQGRPGQKPQEKNCRPAQRKRPPTGAPKEGLVAALAVIRSRFGFGAIGLGCGGIRYSCSRAPLDPVALQ